MHQLRQTRCPRSTARTTRAGALCFLALFLGATACAPRRPAADSGAPRGAAREGVRLILFVVVDQMRFDYLERFRPLYSAGLARLLEESVSFTEARHDHAVTTTAPGHSTLSTGLHPSHHGVVNNGWWDATAGDWNYATDDEKFDRSPRRLLGSALGDWAKRANGRSKVFTASAKDRSAIFLGGRNADAAFWMDLDDGEFESSDYYPRRSPRWLEEFNDQGLPAREFGRGWSPAELPPGTPPLADLGIEELDRGVFPNRFPHVLGGLNFAPEEFFFDQLSDAPFADRYLARFATALLDGEGLGKDGDVDLLGVSFSAVDAVGHAWGPNSPELVDALVNLDLALGELLAVVDQRVGLEHVLVSLSADHGVVPLPEYQQLHGLAGKRLDGAGVQCLQQLGERLADRFGKRVLNPYGHLEPKALAVASRDEIDGALQTLAGNCPGVARVWTRKEAHGRGRRQRSLPAPLREQLPPGQECRAPDPVRGGVPAAALDRHHPRLALRLRPSRAVAAAPARGREGDDRRAGLDRGRGTHAGGPRRHPGAGGPRRRRAYGAAAEEATLAVGPALRRLS